MRWASVLSIVLVGLVVASVATSGSFNARASKMMMSSSSNPGASKTVNPGKLGLGVAERRQYFNNLHEHAEHDADDQSSSAKRNSDSVFDVLFGGSSDDIAAKRSKAYAQKMMACDAVQSPGYAIVGVRGSQTLFAESKGLASKSSPFRLADSSTQWPVGSTTKAFATATLIGILVDDGQLGWDDKIVDLLPGFKANNTLLTQTITVADFLSMQSGVPRNDVAWFASVVSNRTNMMLNFGSLVPAVLPRTQFNYNNFGYEMLGMIIERKLNMSWSNAVKTKVFAPLGITSSETTHAASIASGKYAYPHVVSASTGKSINVNPRDLNVLTVDQVSAAGSLCLTVGDMAKLMKASLSPTYGGLLSSQTAFFLHQGGRQSLFRRDQSSTTVINYINDAYEPLSFQLFTYGNGLLHGLYRGKDVIAHNGGTLGHSTWSFVFPDDQLAFTISSNMDALSSVSQYMFDWALFTYDRYMDTHKGDKVITDEICERFSIKLTGAEDTPVTAYVDDSFITDLGLTSVLDPAYVASVTGTYFNPFFGPVYVNSSSIAPNKASFQFGRLVGSIMEGAAIGGKGLLSDPNYYQVQLLGAGFGSFVNGKATRLNMGIENPDPVFLRID